MATTTNFGWTTPNDTDLVKDGASAIRTLGSAIDTSFVDLKGGTTGQMLVKQTNTDLDFQWTTPQIGDITAVTAGTGLSGGGTSGDVTLTNTVATAYDAKGDLIGGTGADTFARLAVGANDLVLTAASGETTGLKWAGQVQTWTPTWTNFTTGNGTLNYANYVQIGKYVYFNLRFTLGSTSAMGTDPNFTLPIASQSGVTQQSLCYLLDAGTASYSGKCEQLGTLGYLSTFNSAGTYVADASITASAPFTWTTNDRIYVSGSYMVA